MPQLDFSEFHPLDHWPFSERCYQFHGGPTHHLKLTWEFRRRDEVLGFLWYRPFRCMFGKHSWQVWARGKSLDNMKEIQPPANYTAICRYCPADRPATEDEWW